MKTFLVSAALFLVSFFGFSNKAKAQVDVTNDMACVLTFSINFGSPCGVQSVAVPPGSTVHVGGSTCGTPVSVTVFDAFNTVTCGNTGTLCGVSATVTACGFAHLIVHP